MAVLRLTIVTPKRVMLEREIEGITVPSSEGEVTILPRHARLFALLAEGVVRYWQGEEEDFLAIGGGYVETDGDSVKLLVSRAYRQDEIDEKLTSEAVAKAKTMLKTVKTAEDQREAAALLRRSVVDMKLLKKRRKKV